MKVFLVTPNFMYSKTFLQPPVELHILKTILQAQGHIASVCDFRAPSLNCKEALVAIDPDCDVIVVSVSPYDMAQMYHIDYRFDYACFFSAQVKKRFPDAFVVAIGAQCTLKPEEFLEKTSIDCVALWEAERTLPELIETIRCKQSLKNVPNLVINDRGYASFTFLDPDYAHPPSEFFDCQPSWNEVDFSRYYGYSLTRGVREAVHNWGVILASRGCKYKCSFCFNFFSNSVRCRSVDSVVSEMRTLKESGVETLFFLDYTFSQDRDWAVDLCRKIEENNLAIRWICQTRCDCIDKELISLMRRAGCAGIELGMESFDDCNLLRLNKGISTSQVVNAIEMCRSNQIDVSVFLMAGTPFESIESISSTIDMLDSTGVSFIPIVYTPRLGSSLGDAIAKKHHAFSWKELTALRGKVSDSYSVVDLTKDHSVLKGESMGSVPTNFSNRMLGSDITHHRVQFSSTLAIEDGAELSDVLLSPDEKVAQQKTPFASLTITSACPFSCIYCGQGGESTIGPKGLMSIETIMEVTLRLKVAGFTKIRLTGGEPLTHPHFGDILRFLSEQGFYVLVNTNGYYVEDKLDDLSRTSSNIHFAVSLDTLVPKKFDYVSGTTGQLEKVIRGIEILQKLGYLMRINMVVGQFNVDEVEDMITFCQEKRCDLKLQEVASVPFPNSDWDSIHTDFQDIERMLSIRSDRILVHDYARSFGIPVKVFEVDGVYVTLKSMSNGSRYDISGICKQCSHLPCHEGLYDVYILSDGSLASCRWCRFGSFETLDEDIVEAVEIFRRSVYLGKQSLKKMNRIETASAEGVDRL